MVTMGILPPREYSHGRTGNRTRDLMISSQRLWPLDHEAGHIWKIGVYQIFVHFSVVEMSNVMLFRGYWYYWINSNLCCQRDACNKRLRDSQMFGQRNSHIEQLRNESYFSRSPGNRNSGLIEFGPHIVLDCTLKTGLNFNLTASYMVVLFFCTDTLKFSPLCNTVRIREFQKWYIHEYITETQYITLTYLCTYFIWHNLKWGFVYNTQPISETTLFCWKILIPWPLFLPIRIRWTWNSVWDIG
jgi:hypothetical protein